MGDRLEHFEILYAGCDDPWNVRGAWYEQRKRAILLASLGRPRYRSAFEPGCGNGEMSAALAARCERLLACDGAAGALAAAAPWRRRRAACPMRGRTASASSSGACRRSGRTAPRST